MTDLVVWVINGDSREFSAFEGVKRGNRFDLAG